MRWARRTALDVVRWVVVDCETTGLDMARDRLLAIGAVGVTRAAIALGERFHAFVGQEQTSTAANILVHGISGEMQRSGRPVAEVIAEFQTFVGEARPVAFHAPFDATVLRRHGLKLAHSWVDLATLMPALFPDRSPRQSSLDPWLGEFGVPTLRRHDALADAFATAQLLLVAFSELKRRGLATVEDLVKTERAGRWLARH
jgi:DNA polymerase III subunit epsilon